MDILDVHVYSVDMSTIQERIASGYIRVCQGKLCQKAAQWLRFTSDALLLPHKLPHIPKRARSEGLQLYCNALGHFIYFHSLAGTQEALENWKKVSRVWTKLGLYIPMGLAECYWFPKHWTYFSWKSQSKCSAIPPAPLILTYMQSEVEPKLFQCVEYLTAKGLEGLIGNVNRGICFGGETGGGWRWSGVILSGTKSSKCSFE